MLMLLVCGMEFKMEDSRVQKTRNKNVKLEKLAAIFIGYNRIICSR